MSDFNQDIENLLNAYDSNWDDYLILREQFIEKYSLSVDKLQEQLNTAKKALTELEDITVYPVDKYDDSCGYDWESAIEKAEKTAQQALAAIAGKLDMPNSS